VQLGEIGVEGEGQLALREPFSYLRRSVSSGSQKNGGRGDMSVLDKMPDGAANPGCISPLAAFTGGIATADQPHVRAG